MLVAKASERLSVARVFDCHQCQKIKETGLVIVIRERARGDNSLKSPTGFGFKAGEVIFEAIRRQSLHLDRMKVALCRDVRRGRLKGPTFLRLPK
jgi:hypothetical protein